MGDNAIKRIATRLTNSLKRTFTATDLCILHQTSRLPLPSIKSVRPISANSHCISNFTCSCGESYIGRTDRHLGTRMKEHVPRWVQDTMPTQSTSTHSHNRLPASSIGQRQLQSGHKVDLAEAFTVTLRHHNARVLRFAEALAIMEYTPPLCVHKQLFVCLKLPWSGHTNTVCSTLWLKTCSSIIFLPPFHFIFYNNVFLCYWLVGTEEPIRNACIYQCSSSHYIIQIVEGI